LNPTRSLLVLVVILAASLRLPALSSVPPGLNQDEASRGYDAWSLWETGADRHGRAWPLFLESFGPGDYTAALSTYLTIPFVAILGPTPLAMRLPDALLGIASVVALYSWISRQFGPAHGLIAGLILAADPAHVALTRTAHEAGFAPFFLITALFALNRSGLLTESASNRDGSWSLVAGFMLSLHAWIYPATRLFTPLFILTAVIIYGSDWFVRAAQRRRLCWCAAGILIGGLPLIWTAITAPNQLSARAGAVLIPFSELSLIQSVWTFLKNLALNLDPRYLFLQCDDMSGAPLPGLGRHLPILAPFFVVGLFHVITVCRTSRFARLLIAWLLLYAVPAAICKDWNPHPLRTVCGLALIPIIAARGAVLSARWFGTLTLPAQRYIGLATCFAISANFVYFLDGYYRRFPAVAESGYQAPLFKAMQWAASWKGRADFILVTNWSNQPYIYALLAEPIAPKQLRDAPPVIAEGPLGFHQVLKAGRCFFTPRYPDKFPESVTAFKSLWDALPPNAEGLVLEKPGKFSEGQVLAEFTSGTPDAIDQSYEVRLWKRGSVGVGQGG
jgi:4-amino-4-deoxy-L-arabinose transferase-like glycosyltransferase